MKQLFNLNIKYLGILQQNDFFKYIFPCIHLFNLISTLNIIKILIQI